MWKVGASSAQGDAYRTLMNPETVSVGLKPTKTVSGFTLNASMFFAVGCLLKNYLMLLCNGDISD